MSELDTQTQFTLGEIKSMLWFLRNRFYASQIPSVRQYERDLILSSNMQDLWHEHIKGFLQQIRADRRDDAMTRMTHFSHILGATEVLGKQLHDHPEDQRLCFVWESFERVKDPSARALLAGAVIDRAFIGSDRAFIPAIDYNAIPAHIKSVQGFSKSMPQDLTIYDIATAVLEGKL